jgi:hypothetical protein
MSLALIIESIMWRQCVWLRPVGLKCHAGVSMRRAKPRPRVRSYVRHTVDGAQNVSYRPGTRCIDQIVDPPYC